MRARLRERVSSNDDDDDFVNDDGCDDFVNDGCGAWRPFRVCVRAGEVRARAAAVGVQRRRPGRWRFPRFLAGTDVAPALLVAALAFTNGHLASVCMMYGPSRLVPRERAEEGVKMSFACIAGLGAGSVASFALYSLLQS